MDSKTAANTGTRKSACCITVSGLLLFTFLSGMLHALPGLLNATSNCWPMLLLSSAPDSRKLNQGAFQEAPQLPVAAAYAKYLLVFGFILFFGPPFFSPLCS